MENERHETNLIKSSDETHGSKLESYTHSHTYTCIYIIIEQANEIFSSSLPLEMAALFEENTLITMFYILYMGHGNKYYGLLILDC